ncbi:MAG: FAD-dependent oxidoreductase [Lachnospiraceae bacterium]|nr:FAD-dependent oxidoreductase [Lachnospiraceae bacterium]
MGKYDCLFQPMKIGGVEIKNRIVMEPMGIHSHRLVNEDGSFTEDGITYYETIAKGGTGLVITSAMPVNANFDRSKGSKASMDLAGEEFVENTKKMAARLHSHGTKVFMQLSAGAGRVLPAFIAEGEPIAPSDGLPNFWDPSTKHRALTREEIQDYIDKFGQAAKTAMDAGVDGVEIHAIHEGYLLDQFTLTFCNKRTDEYGGSLEGRLLFAKRIVESIKAACGKEFPVSMRYSVRSFMKGFNDGAVPGEDFVEVGRDLQEGIEVAKLLESYGYDCLNADNGTYDFWWFPHPPVYMPEACNLKEATEIKKHVSIPVICAGRMENPDTALDAVSSGKVDGIGMARQLLADPMWPTKLQQEEPDDIRPCIACHAGCLNRIFKGQDICCALNPAAAREKQYALIPAEKPKKVLVVGGGIGGMEAARVCAIRGHQVTLCEKTDRLGGMFIAASNMSFKASDKRLIKWYEKQMQDLPIDVRMKTEATDEMIAELNPDVLFIAMGSTPRMLRIPGADSAYVLNAVTALNEPEKVAGNRIVIIGGGLTGCEIAYEYAKMGRQVTILEALDQYLNVDIAAANKNLLLALLKYTNVTVHTSAKVVSLEDNKVCFQIGEKTEEIAADTVIVSIGYISDAAVSAPEGREVYTIGDAGKVSNLLGAVWSAYEAAMNV